MAETYTSKYATGAAVDAALDKADSALQGSTGSTDNAILRADGAGGNTAQAGGLVLVLSDDGAMQFTGTAAAPNAPGAGSIDLNTKRTNATNVASGSSAFCYGENCKASSNWSVAIGKECNASGTDCGIALGRSAQAIGAYASVAIGFSATASGNTSVAIGDRTTAAGADSTAVGGWNRATNQLQFVCGGGIDPMNGENQANIQTFYSTTADAVAKVLTINNATARMVIPARRAITFTGLVTAMSDSTDGYKVAGWEIKGILTRDASNNTRIVGTPSITLLGADADAATWAVTSITADDTNEALSITVTGEAATNIRWNVSLFYGQIGYA